MILPWMPDHIEATKCMTAFHVQIDLSSKLTYIYGTCVLSAKDFTKQANIIPFSRFSFYVSKKTNCTSLTINFVYQFLPCWAT